MEGGTRQTLTEEDAAAIAAYVPHVAATAPSVRGSFQIIRGNRNWNTVVNGTTPEYFAIREWQLSAGRHFSRLEESGAGTVALLGAAVRDQLFGTEDPVGKRVRIGAVSFQVIGVLSRKGVSGAGQRQDDAVFVPLSAAKLRLLGSAGSLDRRSVHYILVKARSDRAMEMAARGITGLLRQRHRLRAATEDDFRISDPAEAMAAQNASTNTFAWLLAAVGSVSLLVGGISIMNIMIVSVTERTREIGIRLAVGARRRDLRNQFLIEALTLCLFGGLIGIVLGTAVSVLVARLADWPIFLGLDAIALAVGYASAVGIFFGYYPAEKAARMRPVQALRTE
jgi:putative ABC transport system permease protein